MGCDNQMGSDHEDQINLIKIEVIHEETITPSSPTPHHLRFSSLSVFDQLTPEIYVPLLLFYPNNSVVIDHHSLVSERCKLLKTSLSEALTHFYPFAGTFQFNISICCDDHGAAFVEARANCPISKILEKPDLGILKHLLPADMEYSTQPDTGYLLLVQATFFECGGMALGVSISHKVADASTLGTFVKTWAAISLGTTTHRVVLPTDPVGVAASLFPPLDFLSPPQRPAAARFVMKDKCETRRFVFDASKIATLKSKAASATLPNPSRVEVVSALIWKCATEASRSNSGYVRPSVWCQVVNLRNRLGQALAEKDFMGNLMGFSISMAEERYVIDVKDFVAKFRKGVEQAKQSYAKKLGFGSNEAWEEMKEYRNLIKNNDRDSYGCTSWCRFPFHEANFGWGKPSWASAFFEIKNLFVLMDARDGNGIEAWLTLTQENMALFESNPDLLAYASLNPSAIS